MQISIVYLVSTAFALTSVVLGNAFFKKKQFYASVVYITKSNTSMAVIYIQFFVMVLIFGKMLRKIFLGTLRSTEFEHLLERFWYALTETCLAFTVFRDDFNPRFVALFTVLLFLKSFHWLAEERVNFMERSPILGCLFHMRVVGLLTILGYMDYVLLMHAYNSTVARGPTVQLVFGFEYGILLTITCSAAIKYFLHVVELQTDNPWENKAVFLLYSELIIGLIKVILYVLFVIIMAKIYALPMFVFRPMFFTIRNFKKALSDVILSRRAIRNMNTLYPDATSEELRLSDNICIICRDDMNGGSKKLPCGHIFHTSCLRSWFQRQQTCPTCRLNILRNNPNALIMRGNTTSMASNTITGDPLPTLSENEATNLPINTINSGNAPQYLQTQIILPNPFPFYAQCSLPLPPMPSSLTSLTEEQMRSLEGTERKNIEERLKFLENIRLLIEASTVLMNQYTLVTTATNSMEVSSTRIEHTELVNANNKGLGIGTNCEPSKHTNNLESRIKEETHESIISMEDIGREEYSDDLADISELRKRRLKFLEQPKEL